MFGNLIESWKAKKAIHKLEKHPIYGAVLIQLRDVLNDTSKGLGASYSEEGKSALMFDVISDIERTLLQPNQVQVARMRCISFMLSASEFGVLLMQPPTGFKYISGELKSKIPELAKVDTKLEEFFYGIDPTPTSFDDMYSSLLVRFWILHLYMSSYNVVRMGLGDNHVNPSKDWYKVCYLSFCASQENRYRALLGMPSMIEGSCADLKAIMLETWINRAEEGHKELRLVWEKSWVDAFDEPSPFAAEGSFQ